MTDYYVKKVRRNDDGQIVRVKTSKELDARPSKVRKRKKVVKHDKKGKDIKTAYLKKGRWTEGDKLKLHDGKWLRTEANNQKKRQPRQPKIILKNTNEPIQFLTF